MVIVELHTPAVADDDDVVLLAAPGKEIGHVVILPDAPAVDAADAVADLKAVGALIRAAVHERVDHRGAEASGVCEKDQHDHEPGQEVHKRPGREDDEPLPHLLVGERARVVRVAVLPFHGAVAPEGDAPQGIERLALLLFEDRRPHADRKLVHLDAAGLGRGEVAELVHGDEKAEDQNRDRDV